MTREELLHLVTREWQFCCCGNLGDGIAAIHRLLAGLEARSNAWHSDFPAGEKALADSIGLAVNATGTTDWDSNPFAYFTLAWLDTVDLTEHGGSVYGSWLTDHGRDVLAALNEFGDNPDDWEAEPTASPAPPASAGTPDSPPVA